MATTTEPVEILPARARGPAAGRSRFFPWMAMLFAAIAVTGFTGTYFIPVASGRFDGLAYIHVHGALFFGWIAFMLLQVRLVHADRVRLHRRIGWAGAGIALAMALSGLQVGYLATLRDVAAGGGDFARGQMVNIVIEMLVFAGLVAAAIAKRRDRESHKRLLLLATISVLGPAWLRFRHLLPWVPLPFVTFSLVADTLVLVAIAHDRRTRRRVHPVYRWAGSGLIAVHLVELFAITSAPWLAMARLVLPPTLP
jgi:hypothetical protein